MASTSQIWPVEETTASTWTGPHRVSMIGPSTVLPSHAEPAAGCCVLEGAAVVAAGCSTTAGVGDGTAGGGGAGGPPDDVGWGEVGSGEAGTAGVSPPRSGPRPPAAPPDGRS